jgi:trigger factor
MSFKIEDLEKKNMKKLVIEVPAAEFEAAIEKAYQKNKNKINIQGFRKGKAPKSLIEKMYGPSIFYEDAANSLIPDAYSAAAKESGLEIVSRPEIDVTQVEKGKDFIFTATFAVKPEVKLGQYKGIEVEAAKIEVTDEEIAADLENARQQQARMITVEDRPVQDGDIATIDYEGFVDGVAFEGGKAEGHALTIGSHSFIDTFEEQLIGKNIGDEVEVNVTFPAEYHAEELAGKPALFKVAIKGIKCRELPELNDEFAQEASEFDTLDEYKADVKAKLQARKEKEAEAAKREAVITKIIENAEMDIPEAMVENQKMQMLEDFEMRLRSQGLSIEQYMQFTGMTANKFMESMAPQALKDIQYRLVLEAIAKEEKIEVEDSELDAEYQAIADTYNMPLDKVMSVIGEEEIAGLKKDVAVRKAADLIVEAAVVK